MKRSRLYFLSALLISAGMMNMNNSASAASIPVRELPSEPAPVHLDPDQIDNLIAPVALFPDRVLRMLVIAATHPDQLGEAQRWLHVHQEGNTEERMSAVAEQNWDASVKGLASLPNVIALLNQDASWTRRLAQAQISQSDDLMDSIQRMRGRALALGTLDSTPEQSVTTGAGGAISIKPSSPGMIYIPVYNPEYVWGAPVLGYYPLLYYPTGSYDLIGPGLRFLPGIDVSYLFG
jgi:hypothetical protein